MHVDVIVIGSGPGGCSAAISCKRLGLETIMITGRQKSATAKDTGVQPSESIHPGVAAVLAQLGAAHCIDVASQGVYEGIMVNGRYNALGEDEQGAWLGHHINRELFDAALLVTAKEQGVTVTDNDTVTKLLTIDGRVTGVVTAGGMRISSRYVIDASGYRRVAGKALGFKEIFYSPPLVTWTGVSEGIAGAALISENNCARFISHASGWAWLAPENHGRCTWTRMELKGRQQFLPPPELQMYSVASKIKTSNRRWRVARPVCKEGVVLCGDAAGIIDPAAGQGILNALVSGMMAAKTVYACITAPGLEAVYLAKYDDWFIDDYREKVERLKHFYNLHGVVIFDAGADFTPTSEK